MFLIELKKRYVDLMAHISAFYTTDLDFSWVNFTVCIALPHCLVSFSPIAAGLMQTAGSFLGKAGSHAEKASSGLEIPLQGAFDNLERKR